MFWFNFLLVGLLLCLMWAGLLLARWATVRQREQYWKLGQLSVLDSRSQRMADVARALRRMDADQQMLDSLQQVLRDDLNRIRALDPSRTDIDQQLQALESPVAPLSREAQGGGAAVATEPELTAVQRQIQQALGVFTELYRAGRISASQWQTARDRLQELGIRVTVNSCLLMAQRAIEQEDGVRAVSYFSRAERLLNMTGLPAQEKEQKKRELKQERERALSQRSLLMSAASQMAQRVP